MASKGGRCNLPRTADEVLLHRRSVCLSGADAAFIAE